MICGIWGFPGGSDSKESACDVRPGFDPWVGKIPWRRKWLLTPVFLPGESHGQRSLASYSPWDSKSRTWLSDSTITTEALITPGIGRYWKTVEITEKLSLTSSLVTLMPWFVTPLWLLSCVPGPRPPVLPQHPHCGPGPILHLEGWLFRPLWHVVSDPEFASVVKMVGLPPQKICSLLDKSPGQPRCPSTDEWIKKMW